MMKRLLNKIIKLFYSDSAYCCPMCGKPSSECDTTAWYSYICPDCNIEFETPDT